MKKTRLTEVKIQKPKLIESEENRTSPKLFKLDLIECNKSGLNRRVYPLDEVNNGIEKIRHKIDNNQLLGELDHPVGDERSGLVYIKEQSHVITDIVVDNNGLVSGKFRILENTPNGQILSNVINNNVSIGQSLRQQGELTPTSDGSFTVSDLDIITWDIVQNPSYEVTYFNKESLRENVEYFIKNSSSQKERVNNTKFLNELINYLSINFYESYINNTSKKINLTESQTIKQKELTRKTVRDQLLKTIHGITEGGEIK